jgi:hypothetical protein
LIPISTKLWAFTTLKKEPLTTKNYSGSSLTSWRSSSSLYLFKLIDLVLISSLAITKNKPNITSSWLLSLACNRNKFSQHLFIYINKNVLYICTVELFVKLTVLFSSLSHVNVLFFSKSEFEENYSSVNTFKQVLLKSTTDNMWHCPWVWQWHITYL